MKIIFQIILFIYLLCCKALFVVAVPDSVRTANSIQNNIQLAAQLQYQQVDSALFTITAAEDSAIKLNSPRLLAETYLRKGSILYVMGRYDLSLDCFLKSKTFFEELKNEVGLADAYNGIGLISLGQHEFKAAIQYYNIALGLNRKTGNRKNESKNLFNLGICHDELLQPDSALYYLRQASKLSKEVEYWQIYVMTATRTGEVYFKRNQYDSALYYYNRSLNETRYQSNWEQAFANSGKAQTYLAQGNYPLAIKYAQISLQFAEEMKALWDARRASEILAKAYAGLPDYPKAYQAQLLFKAYSDSMYNLEKEREINLLLVKQKAIENEQLQKENQYIAQQADRSQRLNLLYIIGLIILSIALFLSVYLIINRKKLNQILNDKNKVIEKKNALIEAQNLQLSRSNEAKNRLFSIISHDMRGPIGSIQSVFELLEQGDISQDELPSLLRLLHQNIEKTSIMLNNLLLWAKSQMDGIKANLQNVNLVTEVSEVLSTFSLKITDKQINIHQQTNKNVLITADVEHVRIMLRNLLSNALKFTPRQGNIHIYFTETEDRFSVHIKDSGQGINQTKIDQIFLHETIQSAQGTEQEEGSGLGLLLVNQFAINNHALLNIQNHENGGSVFSLSFEKALNN